MLSYSTIRDRLKGYIRPPQKYVVANLVMYALNVIEDIESSKEPSTEVVSCVDSIIVYISALFGNL